MTLLQQVLIVQTTIKQLIRNIKWTFSTT